MDQRQNYGGQYYSGQDYGGQFSSQPYAYEATTSSSSMDGAAQGSSRQAVSPEAGMVAMKTTRVMDQLSVAEPLVQRCLDSRLRNPFKRFLLTLLYALADNWFTPESPRLADVYVTLEYDQERDDVEVKIWVYGFHWGCIDMMMKSFEDHLSERFSQEGGELGWDQRGEAAVGGSPALSKCKATFGMGRSLDKFEQYPSVTTETALTTVNGRRAQWKHDFVSPSSWLAQPSTGHIARIFSESELYTEIFPRQIWSVSTALWASN
ncbi:hypothetical protein F4679DRAFT_584166 [Xylaria curta]|nr:hypothetical protein F4679DRAFT_584166 [Xylaria curta]